MRLIGIFLGTPKRNLIYGGASIANRRFDTGFNVTMKQPGPITDFKNIRVLPSGYQVTIVRAKTELSKHFAGRSERSYRAAVRYRERLLRGLPDKRLNKIPRRILEALQLTKAVVGVFRARKRRSYQVNYVERGRLRCRIFSWSGDGEPNAYRAAIEFRKWTTSWGHPRD